MAKRKNDKDRIRICLDCEWMKHSRDDFEHGKCLYDNHDIGYVNSHSWCRHWKRERFLYGGDVDEEFADDSYDELEI